MTNKPWFRVTLAPRSEFLTDMAYRLHVAEEKARVARNRRLLTAAVIIGFLLSFLFFLTGCQTAQDRQAIHDAAVGRQAAIAGRAAALQAIEAVKGIKPSHP